MTLDPFINLKAAQKEGWVSFGPMEINTTVPAAKLVKFARVLPNQAVLDVACGTGVVAITAAQSKALVSAFDLCPELITRARENARIADVNIDFLEADVEKMPYADHAFDVVLSQYGHIFAPQPKIALKEMLRVLKPGGIIAFSTWPPEHLTGRMFSLVEQFFPAPEGVPSPILWGEPNMVRERLGHDVENIIFEREVMLAPALSKAHYAHFLETTLAPLIKLVRLGDAPLLKKFRAGLDEIVSEYYIENAVRSHYLLCKAVKKRHEF